MPTPAVFVDGDSEVKVGTRGLFVVSTAFDGLIVRVRRVVIVMGSEDEAQSMLVKTSNAPRHTGSC